MNLSEYHNQWLAVQVRPRFEQAVAHILQSKGYQEFVPTYRSRRKWSDRDKELDFPLFTGYVFCRFDKAIPWPINGTPGVVRLVRFGNRIATIKESEIETIRNIERLGLRAEPCEYPLLGERVRVLSGPLAGVTGVLVRHNTNGRLVLSVDAIQRAMSIEISGFQIAPLSGVPELLPSELSAGERSCAAKMRKRRAMRLAANTWCIGD
jgi:transcription antitermination factor NusG